MNRISTLSGIIIVFFNSLWLTASQPELRLHKMYYTNSMDEKGVTIFDYDVNGTNYRAQWKLLDNSRYSINYHEFDSNNHLIRKYREFSDSLTSINIYKYDNGKLVYESFERSDGVKGYVNYYYTNGKCQKAICNGLNGWFHGTIIYTYKNDTLSHAELQKDSLKIGEITYKYTNNLLSVEIWDFYTWQQEFIYEYEQIENQKKPVFTYTNPYVHFAFTKVVEKENYSYNNKVGGPSIYYYDENWLLIKKEFIRSDGVKTTTDFQYSSDGILEKSTRKFPNGLTGEFTYVYNDKYQLLSRYYIRNDGATAKEEYFYDANGNLRFALLKNFDSWLNGEIWYSTNENKLTEATFNGFDDFNATITFKYNSENYLTNMRWDFSFGEFQEYWFDYKPMSN